MMRERLRQRIKYLVEHGGVLEQETDPIPRRMGYVIVGLILLQVVLEIVK